MQSDMVTLNAPLIVSILLTVIIFMTRDYKIRNLAFFAFILSAASIQTINLNWQVGLVSLLSGWISAALLYHSERQRILNGNPPPDKELLTGFILKSLVLSIAVLTGYSIGLANIFRIFGVSQHIAITGIILGVIGLVQMSMVSNRHKFGQSALILLIGFEIIFNSLEPALAVQFLMVTIKLLMAGSINLMEDPQNAYSDMWIGH